MLRAWNRMVPPLQLFEPRSRAELNAFAERLLRLALDDSRPEQVRHAARWALVVSAAPREGVAYEGAFPALVRLYETLVRDVPAGERNDPLAALYRMSATTLRRAARKALLSIGDAEPEGRGRDYVIRAPEAAPVPESPGAEARRSTWCTVNRSFFRLAKLAGKSKEEALREVPADPVLFERICGTGRHIHS